MEIQSSTQVMLADSPFAFELPPELEAHEPPEARGLERDGVRLMVSYRYKPEIVHAMFRDLPDILETGDMLVINTSGTIKAAVSALLKDGTTLILHLSTRMPGGRWVVELRRDEKSGSGPYFQANPGDQIHLSGGGQAVLLDPYRLIKVGSGDNGGGVRLWLAQIDTPIPLDRYLDRNGAPIRYKHIYQEWPIQAYQTVYATEPGSAEMPSAGRAFSQAILEKLSRKGVGVLPLLLHTGVSSMEGHETPPPEYYRVPAETAHAVTLARQTGRRVIGVGTTVVRALETVTAGDGITRPGEGWTEELITPQVRVRSLNGLLTGFHEPRSTHLFMLEALAGKARIEEAYAGAIAGRYLWHEFGDLHLILP